MFFSRDVSFNELDHGLKEISAVVEPLVLDEPSVMGAGMIDPDEDDSVDYNEVIDSDKTAVAPRRSGCIRNRPDYLVEKELQLLRNNLMNPPVI